MQNIQKKQRIRRWLDAGRIVLLQETHWETPDLAVWENLLPAATVFASEAVNNSGGVAIIIPPSTEIIQRQILVPGYAIAVDLTYRGQTIRVLSWYLPPGRREEITRQCTQALPADNIPLFTGGDLNYHVPAPNIDELERAQLVRGFLAERSSMCIDFPGATHRPTELRAGNDRQLDVFSVPASDIWKWSVTPCWTDGQSDHAAIIASLHRRRAVDTGVMTAHLIKNLPPAALMDLRSRFGLLERLFQISGEGFDPIRQPTGFVNPLGPGITPMDAVHCDDSMETPHTPNANNTDCSSRSEPNNNGGRLGDS